MIYILASLGVVEGDDHGNFAPEGHTTRAETAVILHRSEVKEVRKDVPDAVLHLMHTNDTHAKVETAPKRITAVKEVRAEKPDAYLLMQEMYSLEHYISMNFKDKQI